MLGSPAGFVILISQRESSQLMIFFVVSILHVTTPIVSRKQDTDKTLAFFSMFERETRTEREMRGEEKRVSVVLVNFSSRVTEGKVFGAGKREEGFLGEDVGELGGTYGKSGIKPRVL